MVLIMMLRLRVMRNRIKDLQAIQLVVTVQIVDFEVQIEFLVVG